MAQGRVFWVLLAALTLPGCNAHNRKIYISDCAEDIKFKKVSFRNLTDSIKYYNGRYVEVSGRYVEGKHVSALVNDSTFADHGNSHSLWVNFTQECPLYLKGKNTGLFETEDGEYKKINNRQMTIHGRVDISKKGHNDNYAATIDEVSYLELD